jgi:hypothetical protein
MIIDIPLQQPLRQTNKGDLGGSIGETFNIDLNHYPNKIALPSKVKINTTNDDVAELGLITKFVFFEGTYFAHSAGTDSGTYDGDGRVLKGGDSVQGSFSLPSWTVNTTDYNTDATSEEFKGDLFLISDDIWSISSTTDTSWTSESTDNGEKFSIKFEDRVYYCGQGNTVESFADPETPSGATGSYTWDAPDQSEGEIVGLDTSTAGIWIPTSSNGSPETFVYLWDGVTENTVDGAYKVPETYLMGIKVMNDIPYVVGGSGKIYGFNGSYFEEVARFPFSDILLAGIDDSDSIDISTSGIGKWMHNNGMTVHDSKLYFLVNPITQDDSTIFGDYSKLAGIWCLDPEIGLYHKHAISVQDDNGEMGQLKHVGALTTAAIDANPDPTDLGTFIFGFSYLTENDIDTEKYAIGYVEPSRNTGDKQTGLITTQRIYSQQISDSWEYLALGFEEMESTDSIKVKYKTIDRDSYNIGITWASTTSFTSTDANCATIKTNFEAGNGYESRILYGNGAGVISQISNITETGGTYTITLDTAHTGVSDSDTAVARIEHWNEVGSITNADNDLQLKKLPIGKSSNWIKYKLVLNGEETARNEHNPVINRIISVSNEHTGL